MSARHRHRSLRAIFTWPLVIGLLSIAGLLAALIGDGVWDWVSWATLLPSILLCAVFLWRGRKRAV